MQNRSIILLLVVFLTISFTGCTRSSTVEELELEDDAAESAEAPGKRKATADVMPVENMPDVKIPTSAEIPSDKDATNFKVPDVKIDVMGDTKDITDSRVDGMDNTITEP